MNSKQKRNLKRMLLGELRDAARECPELKRVAELTLAQAQLAALHDSHTTVTLRGNYGPILEGNRFHIVPADEAAARALERSRQEW